MRWHIQNRRCVHHFASGFSIHLFGRIVCCDTERCESNNDCQGDESQSATHIELLSLPDCLLISADYVIEIGLVYIQKSVETISERDKRLFMYIRIVFQAILTKVYNVEYNNALKCAANVQCFIDLTKCFRHYFLTL